MQTYNMPLSIRGLGISSLVLGVLGAALYWWTPLGLICSLAGLMLGFAGWVLARRRTPGLGLAIAGTVVSLAAVILNLAIADLGLEFIRFQALR